MISTPQAPEATPEPDETATTDEARHLPPRLPDDAVSEEIADRLRAGDFAVGEEFPMVLDGRTRMVKFGGTVSAC